jgi:hypothetical protein
MEGAAWAAACSIENKDISDIAGFVIDMIFIIDLRESVSFLV